MLINPEKIKYKFPVDARGKITSGIKGSKDSKGKKSLDHFNITQFEELLAVYGNKPDKLLIYFPPGNIEDFFQFYYCEWGKNNKAKRRCDRATFKVTFDHDNYKKDTHYNCTYPECKCGCNVYFNAFIGNPQTGKIIDNFHKTYLFRTGSEDNGNKIYTALKMKEHVLFGQAFVLFVEMVTDGDKSYPIWNIEPRFHANKMLESSNIGFIEVEKSNISLTAGSQENSKMLSEAKESCNPDRENESAEESLMHEADNMIVKINSIEEYEEVKNKVARIYKIVNEQNKETIARWMNNTKNRIDEQFLANLED